MSATLRLEKDEPPPPAAEDEYGTTRTKPNGTAEPSPLPMVLDPKAPMVTARMFVARSYITDDMRTLHHFNGSFHRWTGTHYPEDDGARLRAELYALLEHAKQAAPKGALAPFNPNRNKVADILEALAAVTNVTSRVPMPRWLCDNEPYPPAELIICANGILHLPTRTLIPHTPLFFCADALGFDYDANASQPAVWTDFLNQIWPTDQEAKDTLQEVFGLMLTGDTKFQKAFMLVGPKRCGKGTIGRVLTALLGPDSCCSPTLSGMATPFGIAPLIGKRLAIISDARLGGRTDGTVVTERLLSITGEDGMTIDRKYLPAWTGRLQARFCMLTNELPRLSDSSGALASRFIILSLVESFYGREDLGLTNKLLAKLPGILNWAIEGWERLQKRGYFIQPKSSEAKMQELEDFASPVSAFVREVCTVKPGMSIECGALYTAWSAWCSREGRDKPGTSQAFGRDLHAAFPQITVTQPRLPNGKRQRLYQGIVIASST